MPYDDPEPNDPMVLVGVALPSGPEAQREMAGVFADEFARMGYDTAKIMSLFRQPFYAGAHGALRELGEEAIVSIVEESVGVWGRVRLVDRETPPLLSLGSGPDSQRGPAPATGPSGGTPRRARGTDGSFSAAAPDGGSAPDTEEAGHE